MSLVTVDLEDELDLLDDDESDPSSRLRPVPVRTTTLTFPLLGLLSSFSDSLDDEYDEDEDDVD